MVEKRTDMPVIEVDNITKKYFKNQEFSLKKHKIAPIIVRFRAFFFTYCKIFTCKGCSTRFFQSFNHAYHSFSPLKP